MTTPALTATVAAPGREPPQPAARGKADDDGLNFGSVLNERPANRPASAPQRHGDETAGAAPAIRHGDARDSDHDSPAAGAGAGTNLAQLALYIASQSRSTEPENTQSGDSRSASGHARAARPAPVPHGAPLVAGEAAGADLSPQNSGADAGPDPAHGAAGFRQAKVAADAIQGVRPSPARERTSGPASSAPHRALPKNGAAHEAASPLLTASQDPRGLPQERQTVQSGANRAQPHDAIAMAPAATAAGHAKRDSAVSAPPVDATLLSPALPPLSATGAATGQPAQLAVQAPVHSQQWAGEFAGRFVSLTQSGHGTHTAQLRLDPPNLGPLHISINISDNTAHAVFTSAHAAVRHAVENALPQLQQQLAQTGISLGQTTVNDQATPRDHDAGASSTGRKRSAGGVPAAGAPAGAAIPMPGARRQSVPNAIVDTFA